MEHSRHNPAFRIAFVWSVGVLLLLSMWYVMGSPPNVRAAERTAEVKEIFDLNKQISAKENRLEEIQRQIEQHRRSITKEQGKARTLQQRLVVLDDRITKQQLEIERVETEHEQVELEIDATQLELDNARTRMARQRVLLGALLTELWREDGQPALHVVLASESVGTYFSNRNRLALVQHHLGTILADVRAQREAFAATERELTARRDELQALNTQLQEERMELKEEQDAKERFLVATKHSERRYQQLVEELKAEVAAIDTEIVTLEAQVRAKLSAIDENFGSLGRVAFSWPVPNRGITTYFHDPEYPFRYIFEHPGLDVRASQGSAIIAPAPGYVAKVKDAGYGYSYVMLVHPGGFSTVYGHVSCFRVEEGTYVDRGDPVGCVGGAPGTRGAGRLTTGAHLHFEIRLNGIPVDPLNYLL